MSGKRGKFALGALIGAGAGYVTALLTATKTGKRTRKDIAKSATKARVKGEKQLKVLHSELNGLIVEADKKSKNARARANKELIGATAKAKKSKEKARLLLSALHDGDVEDPDLQKVINEVKQAKGSLGKFLKR